MAIRTDLKQRAQPAASQPGNSGRYLYWKLSENEFQQLCGALLRRHWPDAHCYPVGMADKGRDIKRGSVVYQVKWSRNTERKPDQWLANTLEKEKSKIESLIREYQISEYLLMTSVAATTSSQDRLQEILDKYSKDLGITVDCWWQADIDADVDSAPLELKCAYINMLAGFDAILAFLQCIQQGENIEPMAEVALSVMKTQWIEDSSVKFAQIDMMSVNIFDLFVDIPVTLPQERPLPLESAHRSVDFFLDNHSHPFHYLLGVPGQGKSTLGQYLSQIHRATLLSEIDASFPVPPHAVTIPRIAFRIDLRDYAAWLSGSDPFSDDPKQKPTRRSKDQSSLETFLAYFCQVKSGGIKTNSKDIHNFLSRYPSFLVLDGLDEIAEPNLRLRAIKEIDSTATRLRSGDLLQIVVTARPNASGLAEPDSRLFQTVNLEPMDTNAQYEFLRKWCDANGLSDRDRIELERVFENRTALDHVSQLADNPMQLAILLFLIHRRRDAVPVSRTPLYTAYMETLMDREVSRKQIDRDRVAQVHEVTSYLGWHMHSGVEIDAGAERMSRPSIVQELWNYFYSMNNEKTTSDIESLFSAASERFWALSSKSQGTFEFAVQPVREYFAARFLADYAGRNQPQPLLKRDVLCRLIDSAYWINTARFYAGFAPPNEVAGLRYGLSDVIASGRHPLQERQATWLLLKDGIFANDSGVQRDVVNLLVDNLSIALLAYLDDSTSDLASLSRTCGGDMLATRLLDQLEFDCQDSLAVARVTLLKRATGITDREFFAWWKKQLLSAKNDDARTAWLNIGGQYGIPNLYAHDIPKLRLSNPVECRVAIRANLRPQLGTSEDRLLLKAVLDGWCSDEPTSGQSEASVLLRASRPQWYYSLAFSMLEPSFPTGHLWLAESESSQRPTAWTKLIEINHDYKDLQRAANARMRGRKGTTEPWMEPARVLCQMHGPNWLSAEIAIVGAASQDTYSSGSVDPHGVPLGSNVDYGTLIYEVRMHRTDNAWWEALHDEFSDVLSRKTWVLSMLAAAKPAVIEHHLNMIDNCLESLSDADFDSLAASSSRIGAATNSGRINKILLTAIGVGLRTRLLLSHFSVDRNNLDPINQLSDEDLCNLASPQPAAWPIVRAITKRLLAESSQNQILLQALSACGPNTYIDLKEVNDLASATIEAILDQPAAYPISWTKAAERSLSRQNHEKNMRKTAKKLHWVP